MSIAFSGTRTRSSGLISAIAKQLKTLSLKPVQSIHVKFDPFLDHAVEVRHFLFQITTPKIIATNPKCIVKPVVTSDSSDSTITMKLVSGDSVIFKAKNLSALDMLQLYNKHITSLLPPPEPEYPEVVEKIKKKRKMTFKREGKRRGVFL
ncbi:39S ribosomal protein L53, mitochondrial [Hylaeus volcanicus]|uniref:39S ribosomal protein L53, mitochondrial n=1 Tax=Hylaeus volcanicus TaxID=313075 RepID=UPI0023B78031|nr:39S ribosomal protein L53, mitochondrial [Hylaeus volcanicus]